MKSYNKAFTFLGILACASCFISCSNDNDEIASIQNKEGFTTITVGAPTIEPDGAGNTRVAFAYDNGLNMSWESGDIIYISPWGKRKSGSWGRLATNQYTADNSGQTSTFTTTATTQLSDDAYVITINCSNSDYENWKTDNYYSNQYQIGNNNTSNLKSYYRAVIQNVKTIENVTFSSKWADDNKYTPVGTITDEPTSESCGLFIQTPCLKIKLTLPETLTETKINQVMIKPKSKIFKKNYNGTVGTTTAVDNMTVNLYDSGYNGTTNTTTYLDLGTNREITAFIMLPLADVNFLAENIEFRVFYGETKNSKNYYTKTITLTGSKELKAGKLGAFTLNNTGWTTKSES